MIYQVALTMINGVGPVLARKLLEACGSPEAIFKEKKSLFKKIANMPSKLFSEITNPEVLRRAEQECLFIEKNKIQTFFISEDSYPFRLSQLPDAPVMLYYKGNTDLNAKHIISVVGTRKATDYGRDLTEHFLKELSEKLPHTLVISGLAYGIDIYAHQQALRNKLPTVAVLAHGLDRIYPSVHRNIAAEMTRSGGLLTDYPSGTKPDKPNFVQRNRIVAGLSDAIIVVESAAKGGSMITAEIAFSHSRDVMSFPGRVGDLNSMGCNKLIRKNQAVLITSASDLIESMGWEVQQSKPSATQGTLLFEEPTFDHPLLRLLYEKKELHINQISMDLAIPIQQLTPLLFELEMEGCIRVLPGNIYKLR